MLKKSFIRRHDYAAKHSTDKIPDGHRPLIYPPLSVGYGPLLLMIGLTAAVLIGTYTAIHFGWVGGMSGE
jgi:hypothetical protein